jgi:hypothetical protein
MAFRRYPLSFWLQPPCFDFLTFPLRPLSAPRRSLPWKGPSVASWLRGSLFFPCVVDAHSLECRVIGTVSERERAGSRRDTTTLLPSKGSRAA